MNAGPMLTRVAYQALGMIDDLPAASSQVALIQQAKYVPKAVRTTSSVASSRSTRSKKSSNDEELTDTDKEQDSQKSAQEDVPKEVEAAGPSEYERSNEEDTSTPLEKRSQKPRSVLQDCTSISTTKAEYVALSEACKEPIWLARLVKDLGLEQCLPVLHCDSQSAIALAKNPVFHSRTKHIDVRYHFSRECLANKSLDLVKIPMSENTTEALTKSFSN
ncbi:hypothetical protein L7F22_048055 [Adiantum nelumboides]|nr:hypothetical protein [Adiantum nelumboides]